MWPKRSLEEALATEMAKPVKKPAAQTKCKEKVMKKPEARPGILKKPGKAEDTKEEEKDNVYMEEGEEEEEVKTDDGTLMSGRLSLGNLKTHQQFLDAKLCSANEVEKALAKLPHKEQQQLVWKKFEKSRLLEGQDGSYKELTKGLGSQDKKHKLLSNFILDGGTLAKNYKAAALSMEKREEKGGEIKFNTWKEQVDKYGQNEH